MWSTYSGFERASLCLVTTDFCKTVRNSTDSAPRTKLIPGFWWRGHDQDFHSPMGNSGGHWDVNLFLTSSITLCLPGIDKARGISERIWVEFNAALWECSLSSLWRRSHQDHFSQNPPPHRFFFSPQKKHAIQTQPFPAKDHVGDFLYFESNWRKCSLDCKVFNSLAWDLQDKLLIDTRQDSSVLPGDFSFCNRMLLWGGFSLSISFFWYKLSFPTHCLCTVPDWTRLQNGPSYHSGCHTPKPHTCKCFK